MNDDSDIRGFTLIELLVVIAIIAVLVAFVAANFVGARQRARDVKKKSELQQLKNALRLYYNDYSVYPEPATETANNLNGCGTDTPATSDCNEACGGQFAAGGAGCGTLYMRLLPPVSDYEWSYMQRLGGDDFCLWTSLDNASDAELAKSQTRCDSACGVVTPQDAYVLCAD